MPKNRKLSLATGVVGAFALVAAGTGLGIAVTSNSSRAAALPAPQSGLVAQSFSTPGSFTYRVPNGTSWVEVQLWGAGAGSSGLTGFGGGGAVVVGLLPVSSSCSSVAVVVGAGGSGGVTSGFGGDGGRSSASCSTASLTAGGGSILGAAGQPSFSGSAVFQSSAGGMEFRNGGGSGNTGENQVSVGGGGIGPGIAGPGVGGGNGLVIVKAVS